MDKDKSSTPAVAPGHELSVARRSSASELAKFIAAAKTLNPAGAGRLVFALDATMSRQPTWDRACEVQASLFDAVGKAGGLGVQLVYFRGFGECRASKWVMNTAALRDLMTGIDCRGGRTQISKVLKHTIKTSSDGRIGALVYIGDAMEEDADELCHLAGQLGLKGTKAFVFQEGADPLAERTFREMARLTGGAWFRLGPDSSRELAERLGAVAVYARGGHAALEAHGGAGSKAILRQVPRPRGI